MVLAAPQVVLAADSVRTAADGIHVASDAVHAAPAVPVVHVMNFEQVSPALMRGGAPSAQALKELKAAGVKTIVNLRGEGGAYQKRRAHGQRNWSRLLQHSYGLYRA